MAGEGRLSQQSVQGNSSPTQAQGNNDPTTVSLPGGDIKNQVRQWGNAVEKVVSQPKDDPSQVLKQAGAERAKITARENYENDKRLTQERLDQNQNVQGITQAGVSTGEGTVASLDHAQVFNNVLENLAKTKKKKGTSSDGIWKTAIPKMMDLIEQNVDVVDEALKKMNDSDVGLNADKESLQNAAKSLVASLKGDQVASTFCGQASQDSKELEDNIAKALVENKDDILKIEDEGERSKRIQAIVLLEILSQKNESEISINKLILGLSSQDENIKKQSLEGLRDFSFEATEEERLLLRDAGILEKLPKTGATAGYLKKWITIEKEDEANKISDKKKIEVFQIELEKCGISKDITNTRILEALQKFSFEATEEERLLLKSVGILEKLPKSGATAGYLRKWLSEDNQEKVKNIVETKKADKNEQELFRKELLEKYGIDLNNLKDPDSKEHLETLNKLQEFSFIASDVQRVLLKKLDVVNKYLEFSSNFTAKYLKTWIDGDRDVAHHLSSKRKSTIEQFNEKVLKYDLRLDEPLTRRTLEKLMLFCSESTYDERILLREAGWFEKLNSIPKTERGATGDFLINWLDKSKDVGASANIFQTEFFSKKYHLDELNSSNLKIVNERILELEKLSSSASEYQRILLKNLGLSDKLPNDYRGRFLKDWLSAENFEEAKKVLSDESHISYSEVKVKDEARFDELGTLSESISKDDIILSTKFLVDFHNMSELDQKGFLLNFENKHGQTLDSYLDKNGLTEIKEALTGSKDKMLKIIDSSPASKDQEKEILRLMVNGENVSGEMLKSLLEKIMMILSDKKAMLIVQSGEHQHEIENLDKQMKSFISFCEEKGVDSKILIPVNQEEAQNLPEEKVVSSEDGKYYISVEAQEAYELNCESRLKVRFLERQTQLAENYARIENGFKSDLSIKSIEDEFQKLCEKHKDALQIDIEVQKQIFKDNVEEIGNKIRVARDLAVKVYNAIDKEDVDTAKIYLDQVSSDPVLKKYFLESFKEKYGKDLCTVVHEEYKDGIVNHGTRDEERMYQALLDGDKATYYSVRLYLTTCDNTFYVGDQAVVDLLREINNESVSPEFLLNYISQHQNEFAECGNDVNVFNQKYGKEIQKEFTKTLKIGIDQNFRELGYLKEASDKLGKGRKAGNLIDVVSYAQDGEGAVQQESVALWSGDTELADQYKFFRNLGTFNDNETQAGIDLENIVTDPETHKIDFERVKKFDSLCVRMTGKHADKLLESKFSGDELKWMQALIAGNEIDANVYKIEYCVNGVGTYKNNIFETFEFSANVVDEKARREWLERNQKIVVRYRELTKKDLYKRLDQDLGGYDREVVRALINTGELTDEQKIIRATKGIGTNEDLLREVLEKYQGDPKALQGLHDRLKEPPYNTDLNNLLKAELSRNDEFDILWLANPKKTVQATYDHECERVKRENFSLWGGKNCQKMNEELERLKKEYEKIPESKRDQFASNFSSFYSSAMTLEHHADLYRGEKEAIADIASTVVTTAVVVVGTTIVIVGSGGTATGFVVVALSSGAAGMATKGAIKGSGYDYSEMAIDAGIAAVDTASMFVGIKAGAVAKWATKGVAQNGIKGAVKEGSEIMAKKSAEKLAQKTAQEAGKGVMKEALANGATKTAAKEAGKKATEQSLKESVEDVAKQTGENVAKGTLTVAEKGALGKIKSEGEKAVIREVAEEANKNIAISLYNKTKNAVIDTVVCPFVEGSVTAGTTAYIASWGNGILRSDFENGDAWEIICDVNSRANKATAFAALTGGIFNTSLSVLGKGFGAMKRPKEVPTPKHDFRTVEMPNNTSHVGTFGGGEIPKGKICSDGKKQFILRDDIPKGTKIFKTKSGKSYIKVGERVEENIGGKVRTSAGKGRFVEVCDKEVPKTAKPLAVESTPKTQFPEQQINVDAVTNPVEVMPKRVVNQKWEDFIYKNFKLPRDRVSNVFEVKLTPKEFQKFLKSKELPERFLKGQKLFGVGEGKTPLAIIRGVDKNGKIIGSAMVRISEEGAVSSAGAIAMLTEKVEEELDKEDKKIPKEKEKQEQEESQNPAQRDITQEEKDKDTEEDRKKKEEKSPIETKPEEILPNIEKPTKEKQEVDVKKEDKKQEEEKSDNKEDDNPTGGSSSETVEYAFDPNQSRGGEKTSGGGDAPSDGGVGGIVTSQSDDNKPSSGSGGEDAPSDGGVGGVSTSPSSDNKPSSGGGDGDSPSSGDGPSIIERSNKKSDPTIRHTLQSCRNEDISGERVKVNEENINVNHVQASGSYVEVQAGSVGFKNSNLQNANIENLGEGKGVTSLRNDDISGANIANCGEVAKILEQLSADLKNGVSEKVIQKKLYKIMKGSIYNENTIFNNDAEINQDIHAMVEKFSTKVENGSLLLFDYMKTRLQDSDLVNVEEIEDLNSIPEAIGKSLKEALGDENLDGNVYLIIDKNTQEKFYVAENFEKEGELFAVRAEKAERQSDGSFVFDKEGKAILHEDNSGVKEVSISDFLASVSYDKDIFSSKEKVVEKKEETLTASMNFVSRNKNVDINEELSNRIISSNNFITNETLIYDIEHSAHSPEIENEYNISNFDKSFTENIIKEKEAEESLEIKKFMQVEKLFSGIFLESDLLKKREEKIKERNHRRYNVDEKILIRVIEENLRLSQIIRSNTEISLRGNKTLESMLNNQNIEYDYKKVLKEKIKKYKGIKKKKDYDALMRQRIFEIRRLFMFLIMQALLGKEEESEESRVKILKFLESLDPKLKKVLKPDMIFKKLLVSIGKERLGKILEMKRFQVLSKMLIVNDENSQNLTKNK